jgi:thiamine transport system ATP-binding protein
VLAVHDLDVRFGATRAVAGASLEVAEGERVCLLGPSGSGKSTLLRAVAGLEQPTAGRVELDERDLAGWRPDQRGVGLMFQDGALFPHRDVHDNVAFGLRMQRRPRNDIDRRVAEVLDLVGLAGFDHRDVASLSGGEAQRVALARALAPEPRLLLLDEPLGSLDRVLRDRLLVELPQLFDRLRLTVLYVTHDQAEALAVADRVAVMRAGRVEQVGTPEELWRRPRSAFVATFLGQRNLLAAEVTDGVARTALGPVAAPGRRDGPTQVVVLPEALRLAADGLPGRVTVRRFAGDHVVVSVHLAAGAELDLPVRSDGSDGRRLEPGDDVAVAVDLTEAWVVPDGPPAGSPDA